MAGPPARCRNAMSTQAACLHHRPRLLEKARQARALLESMLKSATIGGGTHSFVPFESGPSDPPDMTPRSGEGMSAQSITVPSSPAEGAESVA